ncbi:unnamed protein product [Aureobasidium mustum]|uniref:Uncharacterized protein n=1 Tax=Aureobasidium mustum TaxID=2773714 RepID=A0A9N8PJ87_9PEZI|nr:unnamed protein product [Aureobasidium mustum]
MAADKAVKVRKTSISSSNSFILTCQHWFNAALNPPTPPPRPQSIISEQYTFSIQVPFPPQDNQSTRSAAIAEPVTGPRARTLSLPEEHLVNSRRELFNTD